MLVIACLTPLPRCHRPLFLTVFAGDTNDELCGLWNGGISSCRIFLNMEYTLPPCLIQISALFLRARVIVARKPSHHVKVPTKQYYRVTKQITSHLACTLRPPD